jgi:hypothetical protein
VQAAACRARVAGRTPFRNVIGPRCSDAHTAAAMRGTLVAETAGSRHAELDVLYPVSGAAQQPLPTPGSAE